MNQNDNKQVSFKGTIVGSSYAGVFLTTSSNRTLGKEYANKWGNTSATINIGYSNCAGIGINIIDDVANWYKKLLNIFTRKDELENTKKRYNQLLKVTKKNYEQYLNNHDHLKRNIEDNVDNINVKKALMKEYLLKNLYSRLCDMGIPSEFNGVKLEKLDYRRFIVNSEYDIITQNNYEFISTCNNSEFFRGIAAFAGFFGGGFYGIIFEGIIELITNVVKRKHLEEEIFKIQQLSKDNTTKINSDITQLEKLSKALDNIAKIYIDIYDILSPIMVDLLDRLKNVYSNNFDNMPEEQVGTLQRIKDILKDLSEYVILPAQTNNLEDKVVETSNRLTVMHNELKLEIVELDKVA